jgi:hypothetical protein
MLYHKCFSTFLWNIPLRSSEESQVGLKLNGPHQHLAYADVNLLGDDIGTISKTRETSIEASKGVVLEANSEEAKYVLVSRDQNVDQNPNIKIGKKII